MSDQSLLQCLQRELAIEKAARQELEVCLKSIGVCRPSGWHQPAAYDAKTFQIMFAEANGFENPSAMAV